MIIIGITAFCSSSLICKHTENIIVKQSISITPEEYKSLKTLAQVILPTNKFFEKYVCKNLCHYPSYMGRQLKDKRNRSFEVNTNCSLMVLHKNPNQFLQENYLITSNNNFNHQYSTYV